MNEFAELVKRERERRGIRAYELAQFIGVAPSWVSRLELGGMSNPPTPEHLRKISEFLHIDEPSLLLALGYRLGESAPRNQDAETIARAVQSRTARAKETLVGLCADR